MLRQHQSTGYLFSSEEEKLGIGRSEADFCQVPSPPFSTAAHEAQSLDNHVDQASHCQLVLSMKQICKSESKNISEAYAAAKTRKKLQEEIHHQAFLLVQHALVRISLIFWRHIRVPCGRASGRRLNTK